VKACIASLKASVWSKPVSIIVTSPTFEGSTILHALPGCDTGDYLESCVLAIVEVAIRLVRYT
jgi:hypothetical protein